MFERPNAGLSFTGAEELQRSGVVVVVVVVNSLIAQPPV
jgi:hypothetical protein